MDGSEIPEVTTVEFFALLAPVVINRSMISQTLKKHVND